MQIIIIIKYTQQKNNKTKEKTQQKNYIYRESRQQQNQEKIKTKNNFKQKRKREKTFLAVNVTCKINFKRNAYKNKQTKKPTKS